jgi:hypothetical protein
VWPLRILVLISPVAAFLWLAPLEAWSSHSQTAAYLLGWQYLMRMPMYAPTPLPRWFAVWILLTCVTDYYAQRTGRNDIVVFACMLVEPFVTPVIVALLPLDPSWDKFGRKRLAGGLGSARSARGTFGQRFPLLMECLAKQPPATRAGMQARYQPVKANFEFLLPAHPAAAARLLAEAQTSGFVTWTGNLGNAPLIYGAGLIQPAHLEQTVRWLAAAGMPGQKLRVAFRDGTGQPLIREQRIEGADARFNFEFLLEAHPQAVERLLAEARTSGFATWTKTDGQPPVIYGAGMIQPSAVDQAIRWLASAGIPGRHLKVTYRDPAGAKHSREHVIGGK